MRVKIEIPKRNVEKNVTPVRVYQKKKSSVLLKSSCVTIYVIIYAIVHIDKIRAKVESIRKVVE